MKFAFGCSGRNVKFICRCVHQFDCQAPLTMKTPPERHFETRNGRWLTNLAAKWYDAGMKKLLPGYQKRIEKQGDQRLYTKICLICTFRNIPSNFFLHLLKKVHSKSF